MSEDPTPLAQRLIQTAIDEIINAPHDAHGLVDYEVAGRGAAVAVLRELANEHTSRDGNWLAIPPPMLIRLADSIEGGAADAT